MATQMFVPATANQKDGRRRQEAKRVRKTFPDCAGFLRGLISMSAPHESALDRRAFCVFAYLVAVDTQ